jgi:hypothetical protein
VLSVHCIILQYSLCKYSGDVFVFFQVSARFSRVMVSASKGSQASKFRLHMEGFCKHLYTTDHIFPASDCWIVISGISEALAGVPECGDLSLRIYFGVGYYLISYFMSFLSYTVSIIYLANISNTSSFHF